ncbi:hypothetical protein ICN39_10305 [Polynucleobacter sp. AP-Reno-20A-A9]|nr:hypothetical protein [Polynucleobacter sp. AP-Reno-20A-A9]
MFNENHPDWERFHRLAQYGHSSFQYFLAARIIGSDDYPNRRVEAYKWASIAVILGESFAEEIPSFLRQSMPEQEIDKANQLIEDWFSITVEAVMTGEGRSQGWSTSILKMCKDISDADIFNGRGRENPYSA